MYATRHNPFVYFHSIIDLPACQTNVVPLTKMTADLASVSTTANFTFITPNLCNDGHDGNGTGAAGTLCANGAPGGLTSIDAFLKQWVPVITASPAYQQDGLLIITFDENDTTQVLIPALTAALSDPAAITTVNGVTTITATMPQQGCCNELSGPNVTFPGTSIMPPGITGAALGLAAPLNTALLNVTMSGPGGGQTGAVMLSPFIKPGTVTNTPGGAFPHPRFGEAIAPADGHIARIVAAPGFAVTMPDTSPLEAAGLPVINRWTAG